MGPQCSCPPPLPSSQHSCTPLQGLPVFYSPGEAEATCAALVRAGRVDAAASFDSDTLVHGTERMYHTLKLSVRGLRLATCSVHAAAKPAV